MKLHNYNKKYGNDKEFQKEYRKIKDGKNIAYNISHLITEARRYAGLTQKQLARVIKTKQPSIARVESGSVLPNVSFLQRIADGVGTTLVIKWGFMVDAEINKTTPKSENYPGPRAAQITQPYTLGSLAINLQGHATKSGIKT